MAYFALYLHYVRNVISAKNKVDLPIFEKSITIRVKWSQQYNIISYDTGFWKIGIY